MRIIFKSYVGFLQHAGSLDIYELMPVYQNVIDPGILQQRFEWSQPEDFVQDLQRKALSLAAAQRRLEACHQSLNHRMRLRAGSLVTDGGNPLQVHFVQKLAVYTRF